MKILSLYKIRDMALNSGLSVYSVQEISNLINKNKNIARVYMNRTSRSMYIISTLIKVVLLLCMPDFFKVNV